MLLKLKNNDIIHIDTPADIFSNDVVKDTIHNSRYCSTWARGRYLQDGQMQHSSYVYIMDSAYLQQAQSNPNIGVIVPNVENDKLFVNFPQTCSVMLIEIG